jgi:Rrf2 family iron-sulfur cluster assembly transcriptional regulator
MFSKSFGYALRGILYIVLFQGTRRNVQVDEIAQQLCLPQHFMSKILKNLVKHGILSSSKGPNGGFHINELTLHTPLLRVVEVTEGLGLITNCALRMQECNLQNPCPLHYKMESIKHTLRKELGETTIKDLADTKNPDVIKSLSNTSYPVFNQLS